jgi:hypothetical protein
MTATLTAPPFRIADDPEVQAAEARVSEIRRQLGETQTALAAARAGRPLSSQEAGERIAAGESVGFDDPADKLAQLESKLAALERGMTIARGLLSNARARAQNRIREHFAPRCRELHDRAALLFRDLVAEEQELVAEMHAAGLNPWADGSWPNQFGFGLSAWLGVHDSARKPKR